MIRLALILACLHAVAATADFTQPWPRHTIDDSSQGADGARLADVNGDGLLDIATPWEEGGVIRAYLNPGGDRCKAPWPAVTVGTVTSAEDAVFVDLDGDGAVDVVSACEGKTRTMYLHWAPRNADDYLRAEAWTTEVLPASENRMKWMYVLPLDVDRRNGIDLVAGAKNEGAEIGWFEAPEDPRDLAGYRWQGWKSVGWIMTVAGVDMDRDGDTDVVFSDRRGDARGCYWYERPSRGTSWALHRIGNTDREVMFIDAHADRVAAATRDKAFTLYTGGDSDAWLRTRAGLPRGTGSGKGLAYGDMDGDGVEDLVYSCEHSEDVSGVGWMKQNDEGRWEGRPISGLEGIKFDDIKLVDLDGDGDRDVLTCEERAGLGLIWYENPGK